jgi:hypothetical protein
LIVTKNTKYALRVAKPRAADRPAWGWPPEERIILSPELPSNYYPFSVPLIMEFIPINLSQTEVKAAAKSNNVPESYTFGPAVESELMVVGGETPDREGGHVGKVDPTIRLMANLQAASDRIYL